MTGLLLIRLALLAYRSVLVVSEPNIIISIYRLHVLHRQPTMYMKQPTRYDTPAELNVLKVNQSLKW
jgi:hypothetical protein